MKRRLGQTALLLALSPLSGIVPAQALPEPVENMVDAEGEREAAPGSVGRVSLVQGDVRVSTDVGGEAELAVVNWPVTSRNQLTTARGARTEVRIGSTAIRLDGDSALDVVALDDEQLRLHLHYGSATIRVRNIDVLRGFAISTPHGRVTLREPGRVRVDAERAPDTTVVQLFEGSAFVDADGNMLSLKTGRRVELHGDDVRTGVAVRDAFDDWALLRDQRDDRATAVRYVTREMTGYEDLDQYGTWVENRDYGPLWYPRSVSAGWVPYRDGRWTWLDPWGWTWVDNAPWGYAPFHYGRWVMVKQRWCWAPGRNIGRPAWAPALVGWVGGAGWSVTFHSRGRLPALGWYPLGPHDHFVPAYRPRHDHLAWFNRHADKDRHPGRGHDGRGDYRWRGLTVAPRDRFQHGARVSVRDLPRATVVPEAVRSLQPGTPPAPPGRSHQWARGQREIGSAVRVPPQVVTSAGPSRPGQAVLVPGRDRDARDGRDGRDGRHWQGREGQERGRNDQAPRDGIGNSAQGHDRPGVTVPERETAGRDAQDRNDRDRDDRDRGDRDRADRGRDDRERNDRERNDRDRSVPNREAQVRGFGVRNGGAGDGRDRSAGYSRAPIPMVNGVMPGRVPLAPVGAAVPVLPAAEARPLVGAAVVPPRGNEQRGDGLAPNRDQSAGDANAAALRQQREMALHAERLREAESLRRRNEDLERQRSWQGQGLGQVQVQRDAEAQRAREQALAGARQQQEQMARQREAEQQRQRDMDAQGQRQRDAEAQAQRQRDTEAQAQRMRDEAQRRQRESELQGMRQQQEQMARQREAEMQRQQQAMQAMRQAQQQHVPGPIPSPRPEPARFAAPPPPPPQPARVAAPPPPPPQAAPQPAPQPAPQQSNRSVDPRDPNYPGRREHDRR